MPQRARTHSSQTPHRPLSALDSIVLLLLHRGRGALETSIRSNDRPSTHQRGERAEAEIVKLEPQRLRASRIHAVSDVNEKREWIRS